MHFSREVTGDYQQATDREWLLTNGCGGFAAGTVSGVLSRRYHGLLICTFEPEEKRMVYVNKVDEELEVAPPGAGLDYEFPPPGSDAENGGLMRFKLGTNRFPGTIEPQGYLLLQEFRLDPFPAFIYSCADILLEKRIVMPRGLNQVLINYRLLAGQSPVRLILRPLVSMREYHRLNISHREYRQEIFSDRRIRSGFVLSCSGEFPPLKGEVRSGIYEKVETWYRSFTYEPERECGLDFAEDLYVPGHFAVVLSRDSESTLTFGTGHPLEDIRVFWDRDDSEITRFDVDAVEGEDSPVRIFAVKPDLFRNVYTKESGRRRELLAGCGWLGRDLNRIFNMPGARHLIERLILSSDDFIVERPTPDAPGIVAGHPWYGERMRDTLIALPGLALVTGRIELARRVLVSFAELCRKRYAAGSSSNRIDQKDHLLPDTPLWFFYAAYKYLNYTEDRELVVSLLGPAMASILDSYRRGEQDGITVDVDGLIRCDKMHETFISKGGLFKELGQLGPVISRPGKPVGLNALWYSALRFMDELFPGEGYSRPADLIRENFLEAFWSEDNGCLSDSSREEERKEGAPESTAPCPRPDQILAVYLPHSPLMPGIASRVVRTVGRELYTTYGLRSLAPDEDEYRGTCTAHAREQDHDHGVVWSWLLGPYLSAMIRACGGGETARRKAAVMLRPMLLHLREAGLGHISEIFDGDPPHRPCGCSAQASSLAEVLRVIAEELY